MHRCKVRRVLEVGIGSVNPENPNFNMRSGTNRNRVVGQKSFGSGTVVPVLSGAGVGETAGAETGADRAVGVGETAVGPETGPETEVGETGVGEKGVAETFPRQSDDTAVYMPGPGLRTWRALFPNAQIYGIDVDPEAMVVGEERIHTAVVSSYNRTGIGEWAKQMAAKERSFGGRAGNLPPKSVVDDQVEDDPFYLDLIIDDGLHDSLAILATFSFFYPYLRPESGRRVSFIAIICDRSQENIFYPYLRPESESIFYPFLRLESVSFIRICGRSQVGLLLPKYPRPESGRRSTPANDSQTQTSIESLAACAVPG